MEEAQVIDVARDAAMLGGVAEVVPAATTVLVTFAADSDRDHLAQELRRLAVPRADAPVAEAHESIELPVVYDGEDLSAVADACGLSMTDVIDRHASGRYQAAFCGFAPGFAYLTGLHPTLRLPRRDAPRTRVPAGSVAIAAEYTAAYPSASPGGWHLIGRTDARLFDPRRDPPALIAPGTAVRFLPIGP